jgi:hypothetical protein
MRAIHEDSAAEVAPQAVPRVAAVAHLDRHRDRDPVQPARRIAEQPSRAVEQ